MDPANHLTVDHLGDLHLRLLVADADLRGVIACPFPRVKGNGFDSLAIPTFKARTTLNRTDFKDSTFTPNHVSWAPPPPS